MIVVFGSINIDLLMQVKQFPQPGETAITGAYEWMPGGKGMNQAVAAARAGAKVAMVGKVGDDGFGTRALNIMRREGILTSGVVVSESAPTGCATIFLQDGVKARSVLAQGANGEVHGEQLPDDILGPANVLLLQMELNDDVNWPLLERAAEKGATTILNLAPAGGLPKDALPHLDYLIVNRLEAEQIARKLGLKIESDALKLAHALAKDFDLTCIITLSDKGSVAVRGNQGWKMPALGIDPVVDRTGAGDTYCGVFAAAIHQKLSVPEAMRRASIAGSLSVRGRGAQTAMPYIDDIMAQMETVPMPESITL